MKFIPRDTLYKLYGSMINKVHSHGDGVEVVSDTGNRLLLDREAIDRIHKATYYEADPKQPSYFRDKLNHVNIYVNVAPDPVWTTSDGREIPLSKMETSHINFAIAKMVRSYEYGMHRRNWLPILKKELERRRHG